MKLRTSKYFVSDALKSLKRNKSITFASIATVTATLFIVGVFLLVLLNINQGIKGVESKVEIKVFLKEKITIAEKDEIEDAIKSTDGVTEVKYETKSQALENFKDQLGEDNKGILDGLEKTNPMPDSYIVKVSKPEDVTGLVDNLKDMDGIEEIQDGREIIDKLMKMTKSLKVAAVIIFIILASVSIFLIGNTIKITLYSRRREIGIMKYIGATDWFIRWPFVLEGMIIGVIGSFISIILLYYAYKFSYNWASESFIFMQLVNPTYVWTTLLWEFIVAGILIGIIGSITSIRKFLIV